MVMSTRFWRLESNYICFVKLQKNFCIVFCVCERFEELCDVVRELITNTQLYGRLNLLFILQSWKEYLKQNRNQAKLDKSRKH